MPCCVVLFCCVSQGAVVGGVIGGLVAVALCAAAYTMSGRGQYRHSTIPYHTIHTHPSVQHCLALLPLSLVLPLVPWSSGPSVGGGGGRKDFGLVPFVLVLSLALLTTTF